MIKQRMIAEAKDKIAALQEDMGLLQHTATNGTVVQPHILSECLFYSHLESTSRKRRVKMSEFQLPEKRKKPVTVTDILSQNHRITYIEITKTPNLPY